MDTTSHSQQPDPAPGDGERVTARALIHDRRPTLTGVLPRRVQTWIMLSLALLIVTVIMITGSSTPPASVTPAAAPPVDTIQPARVRSYQERLAEQEARLHQELATPLVPEPTVDSAPAAPASPVEIDPLIEERRRRDEQSLFADNVAFTRRNVTRAFPPPISPTPAAQAVGEAVPSVPTTSPLPTAVSQSLPPTPAAPASAAQIAVAPSLVAAPQPGPVPVGSSPPAPVLAPVSAAAADAALTSHARFMVLEGTLLETVLINRLDGTFQGPVQCLVTTPLYSRDRQVVLVPAGSRVLGAAAPVQNWGDRRLAVRFHRLLLPNGQSINLDNFAGLNQVGETGLTDQVNRHYWQVFGASLAVGAISGLSQAGTRTGFDTSFEDTARSGAGSSLATTTARILDRYLNILPTLTIREGHRINIVFTNDLTLPAYERWVAPDGEPRGAQATPSTVGLSGDRTHR